jgi:hypothetical protein
MGKPNFFAVIVIIRETKTNFMAFKCVQLSGLIFDLFTFATSVPLYFVVSLQKVKKMKKNFVLTQ